MTLTQRETRDLYRRRAKRYDFSVNVYRLFGFDEARYRQDTVDSLALSPGDQVVEMGCGTGLNFAYLQPAIGPEGRIIAVDLTDSMLALAESRVIREGWSNVELVQADLSEWVMPEEVDAVFSTLAITLVPEYDAVIERASRALRVGGRLAVLDIKEPESWPAWLVHFAAWLNKPFGVSLELADRHPWESIRNYLSEVHYQEYYFGALYLSVGEKTHG